MSRYVRLSLACFLLSLASSAQDTRINTTPAAFPNPPQPPTDTAFVRDGLGNFVEFDPSYALRVSSVTGEGLRYQSADVVMQQCHGGGFLRSFAVMGPSEHTFSSATRWDQEAINRDRVARRMNPLLDNFTRAWRDFAETFPPADFVDLFLGAAVGSPPVVQDPFSPGAALFTCKPPRIDVGDCEFPQYESPDTPYGRNDLRKLGDLQPWQIGRQLAILVAWDRPDPRHAVNILRLWLTLTTIYNVPSSHIAILYGDPAPAKIGPFPAIGGGTGMNDPGPLPAVAVNGPNDFATWVSALNGAFFTDNGMPYQVRPGDRLLIYNTGHGDHRNNFMGDPVPVSGDEVEYLVSISNGFKVWLSGDPGIDSSITNVSQDGSYSDSLQLTFASTVPSGTELFVDGQFVGTFGSELGNTQAASNPLPVGAPAGSAAYQFTVPTDYLASDPDTVTLDLVGSGIPSLLNADFTGGDQELLAIPCGQTQCPSY